MPAISEQVVENEGLGSDKLADIRASIFVGGSCECSFLLNCLAEARV